MKHARSPAAGGGGGEVARADHDVVETVAVDVARSRDRTAEVRRLAVAARAPQRRLPRTVPAAEEDERAPFVALAAGERRRPDDDVGVAVAVDVARAGHRDPEHRRGLLAVADPLRPAGEPGGAAAEHQRPPGTAAACRAVRRPHDDVGEPVAVDVPGRGDGVPEVRVLALPRRRPARAPGQPRRRAEEEQGAALAGASRAGRAEHDIAVAVAVDVSRTGRAGTQERLALVAGEPPRRVALRPGR